MPEKKPRKKAAPKLPIKRRKFVEALIANGGNQTRAAEAAGYAHPAQEGSRLIRFANVSAAIAERMDRYTQAMGTDEIIARLSGMARADMGDFFATAIAQLPPPKPGDGPSPEPNLPEPAEVEVLDLPAAFRNGLGWLVESVSYDTEGRPKIKLHSAKAALDSLAKIRGLMKDAPPPPPSSAVQLNVVLAEMPEAAVEALVEALAKTRAIETEAKPA